MLKKPWTSWPARCWQRLSDSGTVFQRLGTLQVVHHPLCPCRSGMGTYFGGWRIVPTMGTRITKLKPVGGFCAESAGAITLFLTILFGIPVSTTHTITGAIVGVGSTSRLSAVRWGIAER